MKITNRSQPTSSSPAQRHRQPTTASLSRRNFVAGAAALPFALQALAERRHESYSSARWVLFGTGADGIYRAPFNSATGELGRPELAVATPQPTFLAPHPIEPVLFASNELPSGDGMVSSFHVDAQHAELKPMQQYSAKAAGTCFVSVDHAGKVAFAANYTGGSLAAFHVDVKGNLSEAASFFDCRDNPSCGTLGPVKPNQDAPHMHCAVLAPDNKYVLACNLGEDSIEVFPFSTHDDAPLGRPVRIPVREGSGPRHLVFHPNKRWLYCIHELDCTVDLFDWKTKGDTITLAHRDDSTMPLLPAGTPLTGNSGCEIAVSPDGRFVYANVRGINHFVIFAVDHSTGLLTEVQRVETGGNVTRHFTFDPTRRWLVCANQGSGTVTVLPFDERAGRITGKPRSYPVPTPEFVHFL